MKFYSILKRQAERSRHHRYGHAAIIAKGKQIFGWGVNGDMHAEAHAIAQAGLKACEGATLYTMMVRKSDGSVGDGAPCPACMMDIKAARIKRVVVYV